MSRLVQAAAALLALAACAAPPAAEPVRLLDPADPLHIAVDGDMPEPPPALAAAPSLASGYPRPARLAEVSMALPDGEEGRDSRAALLAPAGTTYRFRVQLPARPELRTALGWVVPQSAAPPAGGRSLRYRVELASADGVVQPVFERTRELAPDAAWSREAIDLSAWSGDEVELRLRVDEPDAEPGAQPMWAAWAAPEVVDRGRQPGYDLLWISLDTLRADRLGVYGYQRRPTSPNLDRLAATGVVFDTAVSQSPWTRPSHRSMFTGNYPASKKGFASVPLARVLWQAGWRTGALTGGGQVDTHFGFHDGFATYRVQYWHENLDVVDRWYQRNAGRRTFLFLHTFAIHDPYDDHRFARAEGLDPGRIGGDFRLDDWEGWQRQLTDAEKAYVDALYDGGIAAVDEVLGELFRRLEAAGRLEHTLVVVTSDHGEELFEHGGWRHGANLWDHQVLVPAILLLPGELRRRLGAESAAEPPSRIAQQIELMDLYPTVLELLGVGIDHPIQASSLVPLLRGDELAPTLAFTENVNVRQYQRRAFRTDAWKLVWQTPRGPNTDPDAEAVFLYDLRSDPQEQVDVSHSHGAAVAEYLQRMMRLVAGSAQPDESVPEDVDPELRETLRALGYVD